MSGTVGGASLVATTIIAILLATLLLLSSLCGGGSVSKKALLDHFMGARLPRAVLSTVLTHVCLGVLFSIGNVASYVLAYYSDLENSVSTRDIQSRGAWMFALQVGYWVFHIYTFFRASLTSERTRSSMNIQL
ncbi:hypothetical protein Pmar_PMAR018392 [Perkinsus marinus ATCC 50983]|uniref:Uncharacterized protein n=1 Tax=Perkinsus marinus (strain ATCC 50983 / TXsc) TaxID=423536 RepID=C5LS36_PERM5|nr:hypothetical protein Pmar_PMAR018392 [Perkinsus marinus ATCC 50983]EER00508.1 hypothetical protein Pmar_PMAR018392 [Perkinsus marinus ATCC 50983]|eukprot:XP_002767790.1 hypothetical protein Pmar_PMAR018392 [Perkinsus marinus ATCC 50983]